jgi:hypothetical protein
MERKASTAALELNVTGSRASTGGAYRATRLAAKNRTRGNERDKGSKGTEDTMRTNWNRIGSHRGVTLRTLRAAALSVLLLPMSAVVAAAQHVHKETRNVSINRGAIENLQRWVNGGHDAWCKDAREVAVAELRKTAPDFPGNRLDLMAVPATGRKTAGQAQFEWTSLDGHATYSITLRRYNWLKPLASKTSNIVWVRSKIVIVHHKEPATEQPNSANLSKI